MRASPALDLPQVTVCAIDCLNPHLAAQALQASLRGVNFGRSILFTHAPQDGDFETVTIAPIHSKLAYSRFVIESLDRYIDTTHVLIVQWDGYVCDPGAWRDDFLEYDYIGARWPFHADGLTVGNGGFSLRSKRLQQVLARGDLDGDYSLNEDEYICRRHRRRLERAHGIRFAPEPVADLFSYERAAPRLPTFGFHGAFNLFRHMGDGAVISLVDTIDDGFVDSQEFLELLMIYHAQRKFDVLRSLFRKSLRRHDPSILRQRLCQLMPAHIAQMDELVWVGRALL